MMGGAKERGEVRQTGLLQFGFGVWVPWLRFSRGNHGSSRCLRCWGLVRLTSRSLAQKQAKLSDYHLHIFVNLPFRVYVLICVTFLPVLYFIALHPMANDGKVGNLVHSITKEVSSMLAYFHLEEFLCVGVWIVRVVVV